MSTSHTSTLPPWPERRKYDHPADRRDQYREDVIAAYKARLDLALETLKAARNCIEVFVGREKQGNINPDFARLDAVIDALSDDQEAPR